MRHVMPFPELSGVKVLQGKQSVGIDVATPEGRQIALDLAAQADVVLLAFRAGVADRLCLGPDELRAVNPDLVVLEAPGYGVGPPYGHRPAFAPTMGAGSGLAFRNLAGGVPVSPLELSPDDVKREAIRLERGGDGGGPGRRLLGDGRGLHAPARGARAEADGLGPDDVDLDAVDDGPRAFRDDGRVRGHRAPPGGRRRSARPGTVVPPVPVRQGLGVPRRPRRRGPGGGARRARGRPARRRRRARCGAGGALRRAAPHPTGRRSSPRSTWRASRWLGGASRRRCSSGIWVASSAWSSTRTTR